MLHRLMALDAFYLHARALIEFYHGAFSMTEGRTAAAHKFTTAIVDYPSFKDCIDTINDQVAHLNLARGSSAKITLDGCVLTSIKTKLDICLGEFQKNLTTEARGHWKERNFEHYHFVIDKSEATACTEIYMTVSSAYDVPEIIDGIFISSIGGQSGRANVTSG